MAKIKQIEGLQAALDAKAAKVDISGETKTKITYNNEGIVTAGADLAEGDIPSLQISKVTGLQTALDYKLEKNNAITGSTNTKITYDEKGLVTAGAGLEAGDIPNLDAGKIKTGELATALLPVVPVTKGGTGLATLTANSFLRGNNTENVDLRTPSEVKSDIGLGNVTNHAQVKKATSSTDGHIPKWNGAAGDEIVDGYGVRTAIRATGSAADLDLPTEKAVRDAINSALSSADAMTYKGVIDCAGNPNYPAADAGDTYKVGTAGKIGGASGVNVYTGDMLICKTDDTATGTHAAVGANWDVINLNREGEVLGPASATIDNIVVFDGVTGKLIKDGGAKISDIQAGATRQIQDRITDQTAAAGAVLTITSGLSYAPLSNNIGMLTINGISYPRGSYASLQEGEWDNDRTGTPTSLRIKMPYAIHESDEIVVVYNY